MHKGYAEQFRHADSQKKYALEVFEESDDRVKSGKLVDNDRREIAIINYIPRFVLSGNYADSFGLQWNLFRTTQLDSYSRTNLTEDRFYSGSRWSRSEMKGQRILEAGCGAGRFTEILLSAGAKVYSFDYSNAVEICYRNNAQNDLCVFQGDIYDIPLERESFDRVFCYGVLQHLPDPKRAFMNLVCYLKRGGKISVDVYLKDGRITGWKSKYIWRPITTKMRPRHLLKIVQWYVPRWLPIDTFLQGKPSLRGFRLLIPCWNYVGWPLADEQRRKWAILDTFDALSARYDKPQTIEEVTSWFEEASLKDVMISKGGNGIVANATKR